MRDFKFKGCDIDENITINIPIFDCSVIGVDDLNVVTHISEENQGKIKAKYEKGFEPDAIADLVGLKEEDVKQFLGLPGKQGVGSKYDQISAENKQIIEKKHQQQFSPGDIADYINIDEKVIEGYIKELKAAK